MEFKVYFYILLAVGYYLFKFIQKQQQKQNNTAPPQQRSQQSTEALPQKTFDELVREVTKQTEPVVSYERPETELQVAQVEKSADKPRPVKTPISQILTTATPQRNNLADKIKNKSELRKAFLYAEILKPKF